MSRYHVAVADQAMTKAEWLEAQARRNRPVTDDPIQLHGNGGIDSTVAGGVVSLVDSYFPPKENP